MGEPPVEDGAVDDVRIGDSPAHPRHRAVGGVEGAGLQRVENEALGQVEFTEGMQLQLARTMRRRPDLRVFLDEGSPQAHRGRSTRRHPARRPRADDDHVEISSRGHGTHGSGAGRSTPVHYTVAGWRPSTRSARSGHSTRRPRKRPGRRCARAIRGPVCFEQSYSIAKLFVLQKGPGNIRAFLV